MISEHEITLPDVQQRHPELSSLSMQNMERLRQALLMSGATWEQVAQRFGIAARAIGTQVKSISWVNVHFTAGVALVEFAVASDLEVVMRAESAMQDAIASQSFSPADRALYFSCTTN